MFQVGHGLNVICSFMFHPDPCEENPTGLLQGMLFDPLSNIRGCPMPMTWFLLGQKNRSSLHFGRVWDVIALIILFGGACACWNHLLWTFNFRMQLGLLHRARTAYPYLILLVYPGRQIVKKEPLCMILFGSFYHASHQISGEVPGAFHECVDSTSW